MSRKKLQHHWVGLEPNPEKFFGFIYMLTDINTRDFYVGRKQFWVKKPKTKGCKSAIANTAHDRWKPCCWKQSNWARYTGSSKYWDKHCKDYPGHEYQHRIIYQAVSKGVLNYLELHTIIECGSLVSPLGFNYAAPHIRFRPDAEMMLLTEEVEYNADT